MKELKEVAIPILTIWAFGIGCVLIVLGMAANFTVVDNNDGKMPVLLNYYYNSDSHFSIEDVHEINNLPLADLYYAFGKMWSLGDFLMYTGLLLLGMAVLAQFYNPLIKKYSKNYAILHA